MLWRLSSITRGNKPVPDSTDNDPDCMYPPCFQKYRQYLKTFQRSGLNYHLHYWILNTLPYYLKTNCITIQQSHGNQTVDDTGRGILFTPEVWIILWLGSEISLVTIARGWEHNAGLWLVQGPQSCALIGHRICNNVSSEVSLKSWSKQSLVCSSQQTHADLRT